MKSVALAHCVNRKSEILLKSDDVLTKIRVYL